MRIGWGAGAAEVLLWPRALDHDRVLHRAEPRGVERPHVKDVDALHLAEQFKTLETGGLLHVGGKGARFSAGTKKIFLGPDICETRTND